MREEVINYSQGQQDEEEEKKLTIAEARRLREDAWQNAKLERKKMQQLLEDRYGSLVESAEAIVSLAVAAEEVRDFVASLPMRTAFLADVHLVKEDENIQKKEESEAKRDMIFFSASAGVASLGPRIWRALDNNQIGQACALYWQCSKLCTVLEPGQRALWGPYARQFESRLYDKADALILSREYNTSQYAQALAGRALLKAQGDSLFVFFSARSSLLKKTQNPQHATKLLRQTIIQTAELFLGDETILCQEAKAMTAHGDRIITEEELALFRYTQKETIHAATTWIQTAALVLRDLAESVTAEAATAADPAELTRLVQELRTECDQDKDAWQHACDRLFLEAVPSPTSDQRQALGLEAKSIKNTQTLMRIQKKLFGSQRSDADAALHAHLVQASASLQKKEENSSSLQNTMLNWCDLWSSLLAPVAVRLVEQRVCKGLDAARTQLAHLLDASDTALDKALNPVELGLKEGSSTRTIKSGSIDSHQKEMPMPSGSDRSWRKYLPLLAAGTGDEINWIGERIASWLEQRLAALALDASALAYALLRTSMKYHHDEKLRARDVILEFTKPRFCETLALIAADLRARSGRLTRICDDFLKNEDARCESYTEAVEATFRRNMNSEMSRGELAQHRFLARTTTTSAHEDIEAQSKKARNALAGILILARVIYVIYHSPNRVAIFLTAGEPSIFASDQDALPESFRDARAVVDLSQLRSAFEIADLDGDGLVTPSDCAEAVAAVCVGAVAEKARRGPLRFLDAAARNRGGQHDTILENLKEYYTLNLDELALLSVNALDSETRASAHELLAAAFKSAHRECIQSWARLLCASTVERYFSDDLLMYTSSWQQNDIAAKLRTLARKDNAFDIDAAFRDPKMIVSEDFLKEFEDDDELRQLGLGLRDFFVKSITPGLVEKYQRSTRYAKCRDWSRESPELKQKMRSMRWRDREIQVELDDGTASAETVQLPCEPVYHTLVCVWTLFEQLEVATCNSDFMIVNRRDIEDAPLCASDPAIIHREFQGPLYPEISTAPHMDFFLENKVLPPAFVDFEEASQEYARRELLKEAIPLLARAYEDALEAVPDSELAPLALAVDAYFLRFGLRRAASRERHFADLRADRKHDIASKVTALSSTSAPKRRGIMASVFGTTARRTKNIQEIDDDATELLQVLTSTSSRLFRTIKNRIDPIDLELYAPFIKADAQRFYLRSEKFFNFLFGGVDTIPELKHSKASQALQPEDDLDERDDPFFCDHDDMPPDDFHERPPMQDIKYNKPIPKIPIPSNLQLRYKEALEVDDTEAEKK